MHNKLIPFSALIPSGTVLPSLEYSNHKSAHNTYHVFSRLNEDISDFDVFTEKETLIYYRVK